MIERRFIATVIALCLLIVANKSTAQLQERTRVEDRALGVAFSTNAKVEKDGTSSYRMTLQSSESSLHPAIARISASDRLFVDLPASYGGRLYLGTPSASSNIVQVDSVIVGGQKFVRQYWIVYAGIGMWEGVVNCYAVERGRYYVVSLSRDMSLGKPGMEVNGKPLDGNGLRNRFLTSLQDTTDAEVREFNALLTSVEVLNQ